MNIHYTGKSRDFSKGEQRKLDARFTRIAKLVEHKGEKKAEVVITTTRHLQKAEIRLQYEEHPLVGIGSDPDLFQALITAADKLEKQALKIREKKRDFRAPGKGPISSTKIASKLAAAPPPPPKQSNGKAPAAAAAKSNGLAVVVAEASAKSAKSAKVYRVGAPSSPKPMTLEEAMLEIERNDEYFVFVDANSGAQNVLIRRPDGHFDLVEG